MNTQGPKGVSSAQMTQTKERMYVQNNTNLMEEVIDRSNLKRAIEQVERNKGAPGIDGMKAQDLRKYLIENWQELKQQLFEGTYKPSPVRRVEIPKKDGGVRLLGIPTVLDRFIQQAIQQVLTRIFDPEFSQNSYGFRPARSAIQAVERAQQCIKLGKRHVVDIDLEKFFDQVNHDRLMSKISERIGDVRIIKLIRRYLQAGVMINGCCVRTDEGTPQGGPISPLLANIVLDDLDKELERRGHAFARYADDCNIYVSSERAGNRVFASVKKFIETKLKLKVNMNKSAVDRPWKRKFLGFSFTSKIDTSLRVATESFDRFKERIKQLTKRNHSMAMNVRIKKLNEYLVGWSGYFAIAENKSKFMNLDGWIRRRLRAILLKQWKHGKTKLKNLMKEGIAKKSAQCIASSRKKYWRLANAPQINRALDNVYWRREGLVSLAERYYRKRMTL